MSAADLLREHLRELKTLARRLTTHVEHEWAMVVARIGGTIEFFAAETERELRGGREGGIVELGPAA